MKSELLPGLSPSSSKVYYQFARYYDWFFGPVYQARIHATIRSLEIGSQANVLEIGVGTGISLCAYPPHANILGVDLSRSMLDQAAQRVEAGRLKHVRLQQMDALDLQLPSQHYDYVTAFHVVTVVPDVDRMMREMYRVCKPNGKIVVINHFRSERRWLAALVDRATPLTKRLGWRTNLGLAELTDQIPLRVDKLYKTSPFSLFTVLVATKP